MPSQYSQLSAPVEIAPVEITPSTDFQPTPSIYQPLPSTYAQPPIHSQSATETPTSMPSRYDHVAPPTAATAVAPNYTAVSADRMHRRNSALNLTPTPACAGQASLALSAWAARRTLRHPHTSPFWSRLVEWCTCVDPRHRPSMRLVASLLQLWRTGTDISMLPVVYMTGWGSSPHQPSDWPLLLHVLRQAPTTVTSIDWAAALLSPMAVHSAAVLLPNLTHLNVSGRPFVLDVAIGRWDPGVVGSAGRLTVADCHTLARALRPNTSLRVLDLRWNSVGVVAIQALLDALAANDTLLTWLICGNELGDVGAKALADWLGHNTALTELRASANNIGPAGAVHLFDALQKHPALRAVNLEANPLSTQPEASCALLALLQGQVVVPSPLCELNVSKRYGWTWERADEIERAVQQNPRLRFIA